MDFDIFCFSWMMLICLVFNLQLVFTHSRCLPIPPLSFPAIVKITFYRICLGKGVAARNTLAGHFGFSLPERFPELWQLIDRKSG